jgi:uncharacterized membrane protein
MNSLISLILTYNVFLLVIAQFKGMAYDIAKEKEDPKYKGNHSFSSTHGKIWFSLPIPILAKNKSEEAIKKAKSYNLIIINFWISIIVCIILYVFK